MGKLTAKVLSAGLCALILCTLHGYGASQDVVKPGRVDTKPPQATDGECNCEAVTCSEDATADKCPHGLVGDARHPCRCCSRCGNGENEFCDPDGGDGDALDGKKYSFGRCGRGLACRANYGVPVGARPEMICFCEEERMVCGSDGVTYETACRLEKIAFETGRSIIKEKRGMCKGAPKVVTPPVDVTNATVGNVYLQCEVVGNPVPRVEWRKIEPDGPGAFLPAGHVRATVQTRGGPEEYEVTGWLQISRLEDADGGEYECVGINKFGEDSRRANIAVVANVQTK